MRYSIIIPTYNSEKWIRDCVHSVLAQTFTGYNIIVIDSGSTDGTLAWLRSLQDSRISIYTTAERLSITANWQRILSVSKNEFMTILGHDDILYPEYLATVDALIQDNPNAGLYQAHFDFIDEKGGVIKSCKAMPPAIYPPQLLEKVMQNDIVIVATGFMIRSRDYDALGGIPLYPNLLYADIVLWLLTIQNSYLAVSPKKCFAFRFHTSNTSKIAEQSRLTAFEKMIAFFAELAKQDLYQQVIIKNAGLFLKSYVTGACNKLIYIEKKNRNGLTMDKIILSAKQCAQMLMPLQEFIPEKFAGIRLAKLIDSNFVLRRLFLWYKSFGKRTF